MDEMIPERRLPDDVREQRRAELMEAIAGKAPGARRWLVPSAAAVLVVGVVGGGYALGRAGDDDPGARTPESSVQVAGSGTAEPTASSASTAPSTESTSCDITTKQLEKELRRMARHPLWEDPAVAPTLRSYRAVLARHLDPGGEHLEARPSNVQSGGSKSCGFSSLGTKLGWSVAGQDGLGMVQVEVGTTRADSQIGMMLGGWDDVPSDLPGVVQAERVTRGSTTAVLVTRSDGLVVGILADALFGNNSVIPVSGFDVRVKDLVAAAADPELALPD